MDSRYPSALTSPPLTLRHPVAADYAAISTWVPDAESCARWAGPKLTFPFSPQQLPQLLAEPGAHSFVLSRGHTEALGFCQFWVREPGVAHLARIILAPSGRGQGLAAKLCRLLMAEAVRAVDVKAFTLRVYRDNHPALATYEGLGFVTVPAQSDERIFFMRAVR
ncbi:MAG: GNAT family protein [Polaromonas sp.]|nr:GNAT family protein [Polaromonas sp.]